MSLPRVAVPRAGSREGRPRAGLPRVVATDLDGTLVRSDGTVSAYSRDVLLRVRDAGTEVVVVTGRGPRLRGLSRTDVAAATRYLVCAQGGYVIDLEAHPDTDGVLHSVRIGGDTARAAVALIEEEVGPVLVTVEDGDADGATLHGEAGFDWPFPEAWTASARDALFTSELLKVFVRLPGADVEEFLAAARRVVPPEVGEVTYSGLGFLELCPTGVTKAVGLAVVCARLDVDAADVLAFGDMPNDVPMLTWAGHGVAVANAHPELHAVADETTATNDEDGVARYLEALLPR